MSHLALVGAGAMGGAIGARLAETGTALRVYDLDPAKVPRSRPMAQLPPPVLLTQRTGPPRSSFR